MQPQALALMYHRVDSKDTNPWGICVSPEHFEEQIQYLISHYRVESVEEIVRQLVTGSITSDSVCITFDDGYADNYSIARPILEKYDCPATFFVTTNTTSCSDLFWWDELEMILLHTHHLPAELCLQIAGKTNYFSLGKERMSEDEWLQHQQWKWYENPPTQRCEAFLKLWEAIRPLREEEQKEILLAIRQWANQSESHLAQRATMNPLQLQELASHPLFTIGLHTHTHLQLAGKTKEEQTNDIQLNKKLLQQFLGFPVDSYLSFPFGSYDETTLNVVASQGIKACFTTMAQPIDADSSPFELGRYQVEDWGTSTFAKMLREWKG